MHQLVISDLEGGFSYDSYRFQSGTPKKEKKEKDGDSCMMYGMVQCFTLGHGA